jgi:hypothetical protein
MVPHASRACTCLLFLECFWFGSKPSFIFLVLVKNLPHGACPMSILVLVVELPGKKKLKKRVAADSPSSSGLGFRV